MRKRSGALYAEDVTSYVKVRLFKHKFIYKLAKEAEKNSSLFY